MSQIALLVSDVTTARRPPQHYSVSATLVYCCIDSTGTSKAFLSEGHDKTRRCVSCDRSKTTLGDQDDLAAGFIFDDGVMRGGCVGKGKGAVDDRFDVTVVEAGEDRLVDLI